MQPMRHRRAGKGQGRHRASALAFAVGFASALPALGQTVNPWTPPGAMPPPVYAGDGAQAMPGNGFAAAPGWTGAPAASRFAPPDLEAQLSGNAPAAAQFLPAPTGAQNGPAPTGAQNWPAPTGAQNWPAPTGAGVPQTAPQLAAPGLVAPLGPGVPGYPGAMAWGAGPVGGMAPVTATPGYGYGYGPGWPGTGAALPYGYGYAPGAGGTGWPGYAPGWGGGGLPGMGFSPFGF